MAKIKLKLLRILEIIKKSDQNNPITTAQIIQKLDCYGLEAERKAVNRDLNILIEAGFDIRRCKDNKQGFFLATTEFENWELKVLMDAIVSAKFLTEEDTKDLTNKLIGLSSTEGGKLLTQVTPVNKQIKSKNPAIKEMIGQLLEGIRKKKKVEFQYQVTNCKLKKELRKNGYIYCVNPYALTWKDEHYYLICNLDKYDDLAYYRLDRMVNMSITDQGIKEASKILGINPSYRINDYVATSIYCHTGENICLKIFCQYGLEDEIIDYFGSGIYHKASPDGFECHVHVMQSKGLIYWLMQHGEKVKVLAPESVKDELIMSLEATVKQYKI